MLLSGKKCSTTNRRRPQTGKSASAGRKAGSKQLLSASPGRGKRGTKSRRKAHSVTIDADLVIIEWKDAMSHSTWMEPDEIKPELGECATVGFMIAKDEEAVTVAQNLSFKSGHLGQLMNIPIHSITAIRRLGRVQLIKEDEGQR